MFASLKPTKKPSWYISIPLIVVLLLSAFWSLYWFVAASKAEEVLDRILAREKLKGTDITCANRSIKGFPFKFLLDCQSLKIVYETPTRLTTFTTSRFVAVVMAYNYNHMIAEIYGPFELTRGRKRNRSTTVIETRKLFHGNAQTIKASVVLKNNALQQSTVVIEGLNGTLFDYTNQLSPQHIETKLEKSVVHIRATDSLKNNTGPYEVGSFAKNLSFVGGVANIQSPAGTKFEELLIRMNLTNVPYRLRGKPLDLLRSWKASNGTATISELTINSGPVKLKGTGNGAIDNNAMVEGVINMQISGLDDLVKNLVVAGHVREQEATLGLAAIKLLGSTGGGAVKIALRATKGNIYFGPFRVARLIPLF